MLALTKKRSINPEPLMERISELEKDIKEFNDLIKIMQLRHFGKLEKGLSYKEAMVASEMISNKIATRNWAYPRQIQEYSIELMNSLQKEFEQQYDICPEKLIITFLNLFDITNNKINDHFHKVRNMLKTQNFRDCINAYNESFRQVKKQGEKEINELWEYVNKDLDKLKALFMYHSDLFLSDIYKLKTDEIVSLYGDEEKRDQLSTIFNKWSLEFEELSYCDNYERLILENPIHSKPFIYIENDELTEKDFYFCSVPSLYPHICLKMMEELILVDDKIKQKYGKVKSKFLENKVEKIFRNGFPNGEIYPNIEWYDQDQDKTFENDLIIRIENFLISVESKSGILHESAKRGGQKKIKKDLDELIISPGEQNDRLITYLKKYKNDFEFKSKGKIHKLDNSVIDYYIPLSITLEHFGFLGADLKQIVGTSFSRLKLNQLAPSMSVGDLECIFDLLPKESLKIHYFQRRRELEHEITYIADELDLLSFYLQNGFNFQSEKENFYLLYTEQKKLDPYFLDNSNTIPKPTLNITKKWGDILNQIEKEKPKKSIESAYILLSFNKIQQEEFEKKLKLLERSIIENRAKYKYNYFIEYSIQFNREVAIIGFPLPIKYRSELKNIMPAILSDERLKDCRGVLVLGYYIESNKFPYEFIASKLNNELFLV